MKLIILLVMLWPAPAFAAAYCSLRDPVAQIKQLYPNRTNYLSIIKEINNRARQQVQAALPNNDLHFGELRRHTLYVALSGQNILGYVHVRSEQSRWGLVEIIWAIDPEFKITNFAFQRCRSAKKKLIADPAFKNMFIGKNFSQLKTYLAKDGVSANNTLLSRAQQAPALASVVLRCGLKTLFLTKLVWQSELANLSKKNSAAPD